MNKKVNDLRVLHQAEINEENQNALLIGGASMNSDPCGIDLCNSDCGSNCGCNSSITLTSNAGDNGGKQPIVDGRCYTNWNSCPNNQDDDGDFGISL